MFCESLKNIESRSVAQFNDRVNHIGKKEHLNLCFQRASQLSCFFLFDAKKENSSARWGRLRLTALFSLLNREVKSYRNGLRQLFLGDSSRAPRSELSFDRRRIYPVCHSSSALLYFLNLQLLFAPSSEYNSSSYVTATQKRFTRTIKKQTRHRTSMYTSHCVHRFPKRDI